MSFQKDLQELSAYVKGALINWPSDNQQGLAKHALSSIDIKLNSIINKIGVTTNATDASKERFLKQQLSLHLGEDLSNAADSGQAESKDKC